MRRDALPRETRDTGVAEMRARIRESVNAVARDSPARLALMVFAGIILMLTGLLCLPAATSSGTSAGFVDALFTATSAVCVTGLTVVDTATFWSPLGQFLISLGLIVGGLGVMTLASILGMAVSRHVGLTQRMLTASENQSSLGEVYTLLSTVVVVSLSAQGILFVSLLPFFLSGGNALVRSLWDAYFMAVSIFNNGGFVVMPEGMAPYVGSPALSIPIIVGTVVGALGFPVILDIWRHRRHPARWSVTTKITLVTYVTLFLLGFLAIVLVEWDNANTLGTLNIADRVNAAAVLSSSARSTGLTGVDISGMTPSGQFIIDSLMFIGGGSASTAGGIKVTTLGVMVLAVRAEARGDRDTEAFGKRLPPQVLRLAIAVALAGALIVGLGIIALLIITGLPLSEVMLEVISAFATCGFSTGITGSLPIAAQLLLVLLMFLGRTGTMTIAAALSLRERRTQIRFPEERPVIG
ncbi:TrkH family potassium uptake protein [Neoactinobaculum massilliense]|uniref:TrkH family potassium uptake protein n=1 Tax=Neoactinobaculum massilliense TaxID=2364794 RepID=UPI001F15128E|nr:potassium transporter TrkG [Neoactinobaculum massilliense]